MILNAVKNSAAEDGHRESFIYAPVPPMLHASNLLLNLQLYKLAWPFVRNASLDVSREW